MRMASGVATTRIRAGSPLGDPALAGLTSFRSNACRWPNGVVPLAVEPVPRKRHRRQLLVAHLDPKGVAAPVQLGADPQARVR